MASSTQAIQGLGTGLAQVTSSSSSAQSSGTSNAFNINSFLTMFLTQLKYQDPNNPLESHELAAQLAQFSTVEKLSQATSLLENIQNYSVAINNAEMASLVGKDVSALKSTVEVTSDKVSTLDYQLDSATAGLSFTVTDGEGRLVYSGSLGDKAAGTHQVVWDGKTSIGTRAPNGTYNIEVMSGDSSTIRTMVKGTVYACNLEGSNPYYVLNGQDGMKVPVSSIFEIASAGRTS